MRPILNAAEKEVFDSALDLGCEMAMKSKYDEHKNFGRILASLCIIIDKYTDVGAEATVLDKDN